MEDVSQRYLTIPTLVLLQSTHPQTKKSDPMYVEGADEGLFINTGTNEIFDKVLFVPCRFSPDYGEWEGGIQGDLVKRWGADSSGFDECTFTEKDGRSCFLHPNGHEFTERALFFGLIVKMQEDTGAMEFDHAVARLGGTSFAVAKRWLTNITSNRVTNPKTGLKFQAPMWYRTYVCEATPQSDPAKRRSWFSWRVTPYANTLDLPEGNNLYLAAKAFAHQVDRGEARAAEDDVKPSRETVADEIPF